MKILNVKCKCPPVLSHYNQLIFVKNRKFQMPINSKNVIKIMKQIILNLELILN